MSHVFYLSLDRKIIPLSLQFHMTNMYMYKYFPAWKKSDIYKNEIDSVFPSKTEFERNKPHYSLNYENQIPMDDYVYWYLFNYNGNVELFKSFIDHLEKHFTRMSLLRIYYICTLPVIARTCLLAAEYKNLNYIINRYKERPIHIETDKSSRLRSYYLLIATDRKIKRKPSIFVISCLCQYVKCYIWIAKILQHTTHEESFFNIYRRFIKEDVKSSNLTKHFQDIAILIFKKKYNIDIQFDD